MFKNEFSEPFTKKSSRKPWPTDCLWPEPLWDGEGDAWTADEVDLDWLSKSCPEGEELARVKQYMDELVEKGRLNPDYTLNDKYSGSDDYDTGYDDETNDYEFEGDYDLIKLLNDGFEGKEYSFRPKIGILYWCDGFDIELWEEELTECMNTMKFAASPDKDPAIKIAQIIGYHFNNDNLLRQAFTRRAFSIEYGLEESNEILEFFGDQVLSMIITREMYSSFIVYSNHSVEAPFTSKFNEGELTKIRSKFINKEHLSARAAELGLDKYILYGTGEEPGDSAREDMMEALIGAVAADSNWNWKVIEDVVDKLVALYFGNTERLLEESAYDRLNKWHQKHFGCMPEYEVRRVCTDEDSPSSRYICTLRYSVPSNDKGIRNAQRIDGRPGFSRSMARAYCANMALIFIKKHGLWANLADAGVTPDQEGSINQLQELYQKKYIGEPKYEFSEAGERWLCNCLCDGFRSYGYGDSKVKAKKKAAYIVLCDLMIAAGIDAEKWREVKNKLYISFQKEK